MTGSHPTRVLRTAGVAPLLAVALVCCAGRADAGCGDYVQFLGPDGRVQWPAGHEPMPTDRPCQGPECTGGPKAPVPPAPSSLTQDVKELVTESVVSSGICSATRPVSDPDGEPVRPARTIFRPPRATS